jgi:hypothetical protein
VVADEEGAELAVADEGAAELAVADEGGGDRWPTQLFVFLLLLLAQLSTMYCGGNHPDANASRSG